MIEVDEGYLLKVVPYREKDALITCLMRQQGKINLLVKGVYKPQSKQLAQLSQTTYYQFRFNQATNKLNTLIEATRQQAFLKIATTPRKSLILQITSALFIQFEGDTQFDLYHLMCQTLNQDYDEKLVLSCVISSLCQQLGCLPIVDYTVDSASSSVNGFSIKDGGFVEYTNQNAYTTEQLKQLRLLFKANLNQIELVAQHCHEVLVLDTMIEYFEYHSSCQVYGKELI